EPGAALLGHSSGAVFALETALRGGVEKLVLYEPAIPYVADAATISRERMEAMTEQQAEQLARAFALVEAGDLDAALTFALSIAQASEADVAMMRASPNWP